MILPKICPVVLVASALLGGCSASGSEENPVTPEKMKMMNEQKAGEMSRGAAPGTAPGTDQGPGAKR